MKADLPRYDWSRSYEWNFEHAPSPVDVDVPKLPGRWDYCGLPVDSPLGVPAGPLLNGRWCLYYASLGFDVLTYKTVRSRSHQCYEMPNLQPVECGSLDGGEKNLLASTTMKGSWAVSFGMPSREPAVWRRDVEMARRGLAEGKLLAVSVVGTVQPDWSIDELADDYARCAAWAVESGADVIETNFSCPNVSTRDGQLFQNPRQARTVAARVRAAIGTTPLVVKIGHVQDPGEAAALITAISGPVDGLAMTNSIAATVRSVPGQPLFGGQPRGICGAAIRSASVKQVSLFARLVKDHASTLQLVAVGGVQTASDVLDYRRAGAHAVQLATALMDRPEIGLEIRRELAHGTPFAG